MTYQSSAAVRSRRYVGSRFNSIEHQNDGKVIVWNSVTGRINSFGSRRGAEVMEILQGDPVDLEQSRLIAYLVRRGLLVPQELDEYEEFRTHAVASHNRTDTFGLILLASEECNLRCVYCYETFPRGVMRPPVRKGVKELLSRRTPTVDSFSIAWFGGEPLLGFAAIEDIAPHAKALADEHGCSLDSHITTNGYLLSQDKAEKLLNWGVSRFQVTLDGPAELHDNHRPLANGGSTFDTIRQNLRGLQQIDKQYSVTIRVNFDRETARRLDGFLQDLAHDFSSDPRFSVSFHAVGQWGGPNDDELDVFKAKPGHIQRLRLLETATAAGVQISGSLAQACGFGEGVCYAARPYSFVVGANGALMKCTVALDKDPRNVVGKLSENGDLILDQSTLSRWTEAAFESDSTCQQCSLLGCCQGMSCPLVRFGSEHQRPCTSTPKPALAEELAAVPVLKELRVRRATDADDGGADAGVRRMIRACDLERSAEVPS